MEDSGADYDQDVRFRALVLLATFASLRWGEAIALRRCDVMGHDSERAAVIYQHAAQGADQAIAEAMDAHVEAQQAYGEDRDDGAAGVPVPAG